MANNGNNINTLEKYIEYGFFEPTQLKQIEEARKLGADDKEIFRFETGKMSQSEKNDFSKKYFKSGMTIQSEASDKETGRVLIEELKEKLEAAKSGPKTDVKRQAILMLAEVDAVRRLMYINGFYDKNFEPKVFADESIRKEINAIRDALGSLEIGLVNDFINATPEQLNQNRIKMIAQLPFVLERDVYPHLDRLGIEYSSEDLFEKNLVYKAIKPIKNAYNAADKIQKGEKSERDTLLLQMALEITKLEGEQDKLKNDIKGLKNTDPKKTELKARLAQVKAKTLTKSKEFYNSAGEEAERLLGLVLEEEYELTPESEERIRTRINNPQQPFIYGGPAVHNATQKNGYMIPMIPQATQPQGQALGSIVTAQGRVVGTIANAPVPAPAPAVAMKDIKNMTDEEIDNLTIEQRGQLSTDQLRVWTRRKREISIKKQQQQQQQQAQQKGGKRKTRKHKKTKTTRKGKKGTRRH